MSKVLTVRIPEKIAKKIREIQEESSLDRASLLRKIIEKGVTVVALELALDKLSKGEVSLWKAAELSGLDLWDFLDEIKKRKIVLYDEEDLREDMKIVESGL